MEIHIPHSVRMFERSEFRTLEYKSPDIMP